MISTPTPARPEPASRELPRIAAIDLVARPNALLAEERAAASGSGSRRGCSEPLCADAEEHAMLTDTKSSPLTQAPRGARALPGLASAARPKAQKTRKAPARGRPRVLPAQLGIYLPKVVNPGGRDPVSETLVFFGWLFGGATCCAARGVWASRDGGLVEDELWIIRSFTTEAGLKKHLRAVVRYAEALKIELRQEAIALEVRDLLRLI
jgi:hypothetical protein